MAKEMGTTTYEDLIEVVKAAQRGIQNLVEKAVELEEETALRYDEKFHHICRFFAKIKSLLLDLQIKRVLEKQKQPLDIFGEHYEAKFSFNMYNELEIGVYRNGSFMRWVDAPNTWYAERTFKTFLDYQTKESQNGETVRAKLKDCLYNWNDDTERAFCQFFERCITRVLADDERKAQNRLEVAKEGLNKAKEMWK